MSSRHFYITAAIPYVNGDPHLGHALEFVQADVLARHRRSRGDQVRFLSGTDDNALKNVQAATAVGTSVSEFVSEKAQRFADLTGPLQLSNDDFIRTSTDPRHRPGVERLWRACLQAGDLYTRKYEGNYCTGCEAFLDDAALRAGRCPEHNQEPERVVEQNWFFRLSRYQDALGDLIESGRLRIEPEHRRNETLAFIRGGLEDFSVSRAAERAHGWGIPVPDDPSQVVYVWFDALANYITALSYAEHGTAYREWWEASDERLHVIGKGIIRFHAVYWPAILLSAREPLPTTIFVHDYLTVDGKKISKSLGSAIDPLHIVDRYGADALRWWFVRDVPRNGDADFRTELIIARANELAGGLGNLVNRTISLARQNEQFQPRVVTHEAPGSARLSRLIDALPDVIDSALAACDLRRAAAAIWEVVAEANRWVSEVKPWELAKAARSGHAGASLQLSGTLALLIQTCKFLAAEVAPFLPHASDRIHSALISSNPDEARALFPKATES